MATTAPDRSTARPSGASLPNARCVRPKMKRSNEFRFGARLRARRLMTNWCFSNTDSATTARTPPGRHEFGNGGQDVDGEYEQVHHRPQR